MSDRWPDIAAGNVLHSFINILCSSLMLHRTMPRCCCCGSSQLSTSCSIIGALIRWRSIGCDGSTHMSTEPRTVSSLRHAWVSATKSQLRSNAVSDSGVRYKLNYFNVKGGKYYLFTCFSTKVQFYCKFCVKIMRTEVILTIRYFTLYYFTPPDMWRPLANQIDINCDFGFSRFTADFIKWKLDRRLSHITVFEHKISSSGLL